MTFKQNDSVEQIMPAPIKGTIQGMELDRVDGKILYRVEWLDEEGVTHVKFFPAEEIQMQPETVKTETSVAQ